MSSITKIATELRRAVRSLRRQPFFSLSVVLTLSLGLAGVTAILTIADSVILSPLPYPFPERLYAVSVTLPRPNGARAPFVLSPMEYVGLRERVSSFELVGAVTSSAMTFATTGGAITIQGGAV